MCTVCSMRYSSCLAAGSIVKSRSVVGLSRPCIDKDGHRYME
jgi:hypothetical protein